MLSIFVPLIPHLKVHLAVLIVFTLAYAWLDANGHFHHDDPENAVNPLLFSVTTQTLLGTQDPRPCTALAQSIVICHALIAWALTITTVGMYLRM